MTTHDAERPLSAPYSMTEREWELFKELAALWPECQGKWGMLPGRSTGRYHFFWEEPDFPTYTVWTRCGIDILPPLWAKIRWSDSDQDIRCKNCQRRAS